MVSPSPPFKVLAIPLVCSGRELQNVFSTPYPLRLYDTTDKRSTRSRAINKIRLAPKQSSGQSGFSGGEILHFTRQSRTIYPFLLFLLRNKENALFPVLKMLICRIVHIFVAIIVLKGGRRRGAAAEKTSLELPAVGDL